MARQPIQNDAKEPVAPLAMTMEVTPLTGGAPGVPPQEQAQEIPMGSPDGQIIGSAVPTASKVVTPKVRRFRIENGGRYTNRGHVSLLSPGKVVDESNFDVKQMRSQGFRLTELTDD